MRRIVITGIGMITPAGKEKKSFWQNCISEESFTTRYVEKSTKIEEIKVQGKVEKFNYKEYGISDEEDKRMGRETEFAIAACNGALKDSSLCINDENRERIGICIGNAIGDTPYCEKQYIEMKEKQSSNNDCGIEKNSYSKGMFSCITTEIAYHFNIKGSTFLMSTGCTSGIDAIGYSYETIQDEDNDIDIMICGATESPITNMTYKSFETISTLTKKKEEPEKASSPFDKSRDGFILAEGCGILVLEEYEHAVKRNAHIYCEIIGFDSSCNANHMTDLPSDGNPLSKLISKVITDSNINKEEIDYISAHGSSTKQNDLFETSAYKSSLGEYAYKVPISSLKSKIGHPLGAASAIELALCCLIFDNNVVPPTVNYENKDEECDLDYVPNKSREKEVNMILKTSSGFSGIHSVMLLQKVKGAL